MAHKQINLPNVSISAPKAVFKPQKEEALTCILPKYYNSVADVEVRTNTRENECWFCDQSIESQKLSIETLNGRSVGYFCSRICRDSFACMVRSHVALREEPKISLLPLIFYENRDEIIKVINSLREVEGVYGSCFFNEKKNSVQLLLRSLI